MRPILCPTVFLIAAFPAVTHSAEDPKPPGIVAVDPPKPDFSSPLNIWKSYLESVKRDDLEAAKQCLLLDQEDKDLLEFAAGLWIAHHRFNQIVTRRFGKQVASQYIRPDCSNEAIDRTLEKISKATVTITGDKAEAKVDWGNYDDTKPYFCFTGETPAEFRKVKGRWKLVCEMEAPAEKVFAPGTMGWAMRETMNLLNATSDSIESGRLATWEQVTKHLEAQEEALKRQYEKDHTHPRLQIGK